MASRKEIIKSAKKVIIKLGTTVLVNSENKLNSSAFRNFAEEIAELKSSGRTVTIVSSGAIAGGVTLLGLKSYPKTVEEKQAVAAVGQSYLMRFYEEAFVHHNIKIAQVLLTHDDFFDRKRYVNAKRTLTKLFDMGVIPIVNENDTVSTEEIRIGDNDTLSAKLTGVVDADLLIILSDIDGLYDRDPKTHKTARFIPVVEKIDEGWFRFATGSRNVLSVGGMKTKIESAIIACSYGASVIIANGREKNVIRRIFAGEEIGTIFKPRFTGLSARKFWIGFTLRPKGDVIIDEGARKAIVDNNRSLLPSGVKGVSGNFSADETVRIVTEKGEEIGRGLVNYSSHQLRRVAGLKSSEIENALGFKGPDEVIHRDNMVIYNK